MGFALEDFNPLGQFREADNGRPVDNTGKLAGGPELKGVASVKAVLLDRKDQFLRNLVEHLLVYSLGRELGPYDLPTIRRVTDAVKAHALSGGRPDRRGRDVLPLPLQAGASGVRGSHTDGGDGMKPRSWQVNRRAILKGLGRRAGPPLPGRDDPPGRRIRDRRGGRAPVRFGIWYYQHGSLAEYWVPPGVRPDREDAPPAAGRSSSPAIRRRSSRT